MNKLAKKQIEICEALGWKIYESENYVELEKYSPAGEDFSFAVDTDNFIENIKKHAENFDIEEHVKIWLNAGKKGQPDVVTLVEDARDIKQMIQDLADALEGREHANELKNGHIEYREMHAIVHAPDHGGQVIDEFCEKMESLGYKVEAAQIMDYDDEDEETMCARSNIRHSLGVEEDESTFGNKNWTRYCMYLINWAKNHNNEEYEGMSPACYDEWCDNEKAYEDEMEEEDGE